ncbi:MAG TPA: ArsC/Spx/MgsR family protein [Telmatospirillum sp.]|nr:ArsC/Spx/MgsR family protein [Telmatospirillum sp.]
MANILFFEKPGCRNNTRQKAILQASGHHVDARDLLTEPWTPARLRSYFGTMPVSAWFNRAAPKVKEGVIVPEKQNEADAITAMLADPLLIRRPLMEVDGRKTAGFNVDQLKEWIDLADQESPPSEACPRTDAKSCQ